MGKEEKKKKPEGVGRTSKPLLMARHAKDVDTPPERTRMAAARSEAIVETTRLRR